MTARGGGRPAHAPDDTGGIWIVTGVVMGAILYAGMVTMLVAGFTPIAPLVVIPPVLIALIGANNLLGGGRSHGRSEGRPVGRGQAPLSSSGPNGPLPVEPLPSALAEEPGEPR